MKPTKSVLPLLVVVASALTGSATAAAGTYVHRSCPGGQISDQALGWFPANTEAVPSASHVSAGCGAGGLGMDLTPLSDYPIAPGRGVGWTYTPPWGSIVTGFSADVEGWGTSVASQAGQWALISGSAPVSTLDAASGSTLWPKRRVSVAGLATRELSMLIRCAPTGTPCNTIWNLGWAAASDISVVLSDAVAPTVGAASGSLLSDPVLSAEETIEFAASDVGSGVREVRLLADGQVVERIPLAAGNCTPTGSGAAGAEYASPAPCPMSSAVSQALSFARIADGQHAISVALADASGNVATVFSASRVVANNPPQNTSPPTYARADLASAPVIAEPLHATTGGWLGPNLSYSYEWQRCDQTGESCRPIAGATAATYTPSYQDEGSRLRVAVTARNVVAVTGVGAATGLVRASVGAPVLKPGEFNGAVIGGTACADRGGVRLSAPGRPRAVVRLGYRRTARVKLRLECADDGRAIRSATLVTSTAIAGQGDTTGGYVVTEADGSVAIKIDGRFSRNVTFSYRRRGADEHPSAQLTLKVRVAVPVRLRVRRITRFITGFRGKLLGGHVPLRGASVQLQWQDGARWRPVATLKTDRKGVFRYRYRFSGGAAGTRYRFRAVVLPGQLDYPFVPGRSPVRAVRPG